MRPALFNLLLEAFTKLEYLIAKYGEQVVRSQGENFPAAEMKEWKACARLNYIKRICAIDPTSSPLEGADDTGYLEWMYKELTRNWPKETYKAGKYSEWLVRQYIKRECPNSNLSFTYWAEDAARLKEELTTYNRVLPKLPVELRDINKIRDTDHLYQVIKPFEKDLPPSEISKDITVILDEPGLQVYVPTTFAASRKLGTKTRWCTAASSGERLFNQYTGRGPLIVVFMADDVGSPAKYQLHFPSNQCMDADNCGVELEKLLSLRPSLAGTIMRAHEMVGASPGSSMMAAAALKDEKALESAASTFFSSPTGHTNVKLSWWAFAHLAHRKLIPSHRLDGFSPQITAWVDFFPNHFSLEYPGYIDPSLARLFKTQEEMRYLFNAFQAKHGNPAADAEAAKICADAINKIMQCTGDIDAEGYVSFKYPYEKIKEWAEGWAAAFSVSDCNVDAHDLRRIAFAVYSNHDVKLPTES